MDFQSLSAARYSLRKFSPQPVEQEKLDLILETGAKPSCVKKGGIVFL